MTAPRILVAGIGNVLRGDDGFGIEVVRRLRQRADLPPGVRVVDAGIGGIPLVQDLLDGYDLIVLVDAVHCGKPPGSVVVLRPELPDLNGLPADEVGALVGDPHTTTPSRVLLLARALGALPRETLIVGCEPQTLEEMTMTLSAPVAAAVDRAVERIVILLRERP
ncbi:MAG: hydrogenase maturation protease [Armatimonadota bacterium]|nr:hydrogenase maturation protease [Armatimonadota bacterium]MDR7486741.1 hydrogenase maturation protease [Armatimonadota bacterium]MDR7534279.1 hydrogenase maturation protease [Armatimonadota bacterium]MDR7535370.1 hydrogenase maturation protease [Armatimonadota bacterium]